MSLLQVEEAAKVPKVPGDAGGVGQGRVVVAHETVVLLVGLKVAVLLDINDGSERGVLGAPHITIEILATETFFFYKKKPVGLH